jgi:hypothetical protein
VVATVGHPIASAPPSRSVRVWSEELQWRRRTSSIEPVAPTPSYSAARQGPTSLLTAWASPIRTRVKGPMGPLVERSIQHISKCERVCSLVFTRAPASGSTSGPGFDSPWERISQDLTAFVLLVVGDVPVESVNIEDLPAHSSKMLLGVGFAYVYSYK